MYIYIIQLLLIITFQVEMCETRKYELGRIGSRKFRDQFGFQKISYSTRLPDNFGIVVREYWKTDFSIRKFKIKYYIYHIVIISLLYSIFYNSKSQECQQAWEHRTSQKFRCFRHFREFWDIFESCTMTFLDCCTSLVSTIVLCIYTYVYCIYIHTICAKR